MTTSYTVEKYSDGDERYPWGLAALVGAMCTCLGVFLLFNLHAAVGTLVLITGIGLILGGLTLLITDNDLTTWDWFGSAFSIIGGVAVLVWPGISLWTLAVITGITFLVHGSVGMVRSLMGRSPGHSRFWGLLSGAFAVLVGLIALAWPEATVAVLALLFGARTAAMGVAMLVTAYQLREASQARV